MEKVDQENDRLVGELNPDSSLHFKSSDKSEVDRGSDKQTSTLAGTMKVSNAIV